MPETVSQTKATSRGRPSRLPPLTPIAVPPRVAWAMLGVGKTTLFRLLKAGELQGYLEGSARRILVSSIHEYVQRRLAASRK
jgi:excisionase family DNA binding protein